MRKHENGVSNVLDIVKARLTRIGNSIDLEELRESVKSLKEREFYGTKLKSWLKVPFYFSRLPDYLCRDQFF